MENYKKNLVYKINYHIDLFYKEDTQNYKV